MPGLHLQRHYCMKLFSRLQASPTLQRSKAQPQTYLTRTCLPNLWDMLVLNVTHPSAMTVTHVLSKGKGYSPQPERLSQCASMAPCLPRHPAVSSKIADRRSTGEVCSFPSFLLLFWIWYEGRGEGVECLLFNVPNVRDGSIVSMVLVRQRGGLAYEYMLQGACPIPQYPWSQSTRFSRITLMTTFSDSSDSRGQSDPIVIALLCHECATGREVRGYGKRATGRCSPSVIKSHISRPRQ
ncbi:hypothetical protein F4808DRAFT_80665 [Astrocystis sublimbata]|nr:hypothetical protein F4808DRAFT_80665 [Astrocystis sublimbata]